MAALSVLLYLASTVPILNVLAYLVAAVPLTYVGIEHGGLWAALTAAASAFLVALLAGPVHALFFAALFGFLGILTGGLIHRGLRPVNLLLLGSFLLFLCDASSYYGVEKVLGLEDSLRLAQKEVVAVLDLVSEGVNGTLDRLRGRTSGTSQFLTFQSFRRSLDRALVLPLGILLVFSFLSFYLNYMVCSLLMYRVDVYMEWLPDFRAWQVHPAWALGHVGLILIDSFLGDGRSLGALLFLNLFTVSSFAFFFLGFSTTVHFFDRWALHPILRLLMLFLVILPAYRWIGLLGALDSLLDLRRIRASTERAIWTPD